jgi:DNA modification methylase
MSKQLSLPRPHLHPTVKPVALMAEAIKDCWRRGGLVLDPSAAAGTILIAAERTGCKVRMLEIDPSYVDVAAALAGLQRQVCTPCWVRRKPLRQPRTGASRS